VRPGGGPDPSSPRAIPIGAAISDLPVVWAYANGLANHHSASISTVTCPWCANEGDGFGLGRDSDREQAAWARHLM
jgi:hypothetical protein